MNWLNWLHFLILQGGLLVILIDSMIEWSLSFLDLKRMYMSTVSLLAELDPGILCPWNALFCPMMLMALSPELRCYQDVYVNSFFACAARPLNSLNRECFSFSYDVNGFKSRIKSRHLLTVDFFWTDFLYAFLCYFLSFCASFSCNSTPRGGYSAFPMATS